MQIGRSIAFWLRAHGVESVRTTRWGRRTVEMNVRGTTRTIPPGPGEVDLAWLHGHGGDRRCSVNDEHLATELVETFRAEQGEEWVNALTTLRPRQGSRSVDY